MQLQTGEATVQQLASGEVHHYQVTLHSGQFANLQVEQQGIDVAVIVREGDQETRYDNDPRSSGTEVVDIVGGTSGTIGLSVQPSALKGTAGKYLIRLVEIRPATQNDQQLYEARRLQFISNKYFVEGKYEDYRKSLEQALAQSETVLGTEHPFVASLLYDLARYYDQKQDFHQSLPILERARSISQKTLGENDPLTINITRLLAWVSFDSNDITDAELMAEQGVEKIEKAVGPNHILVAQHLYTLSDISNDIKKRDQLLNRALKIAEEWVGTSDPFYADVMNTMGAFYFHREDPRSEPYLLQARKIYENNHQKESVSYARVLNNLGRLERERKDFAKAEAYYVEAIAISEKAFGPDFPKLAPVLNNLANIYRIKEDYAKSLEGHLRVLHISETSLGEYHPMTLQSLGNIARTYTLQGNIAEAIQYQSRVDAVLERNVEMNLAIGSEEEKISFMQEWFPSRTDRTISLNANLAPQEPKARELAALALLQRKGRVLDAMSETFASMRQRATPEEQQLLQQYHDVTTELANAVLNGPQKLSFQKHQEKISELEEKRKKLEKRDQQAQR